MTLEIPEILPTLSTGSHGRGAKEMCIMNAISYLNGDVEITDMPACTHPVLAKVAQGVNDSICTHRDGSVMCPECSAIMWGYEPLLRGTEAPEDELEAKRLAVHLAIVSAWFVLGHFEKSDPEDKRPRQAIEAAEKWMDAKTDGERANAAANANAAAYAANAADAADAADAVNDAVDAVYAADAADAASRRELLDLLIDGYYAFTGRIKPTVAIEDWTLIRECLVKAGASI